MYRHQSSQHSRLHEEGKLHFVVLLLVGNADAQSDHLKVVSESLDDRAKIKTSDGVTRGGRALIFASTLSTIKGYDGAYEPQQVERTWRGFPSLDSLPPVKPSCGSPRMTRLS